MNKESLEMTKRTDSVPIWALKMAMETDEEVPTLEGQFASFSKMSDSSSPGHAISLYCSDYWMRQSKIIDDRNITMTDTGVTWMKFNKTELNWDEWQKYLLELCTVKGLDKHVVEAALTNCGVPGSTFVRVPQYRDFFDTYKSKKGLIICDSLDSCGNPKKKIDKTS